MSDASGADLALSDEARARLAGAVARRPRGFFTDVDGTISPIAPSPEAAALLPGVGALLAEACAVFDLVAAISGRSALDARRMVGVPSLLYIGNHGMERLEPHAPAGDDAGNAAEAALQVLPEARRHMAAIAGILARVEPALRARFPGLRVERKGVTASIHYRNVSDRAAAESGILAALAEAAGDTPLRITQGKMVVELRPPVQADKGTAVAALIQERSLAGAVYLGDDRTDLDAFRALRRLTAAGVCAGVAVAVAQPEAPPDLAAEADLVLPGIERVPALLTWLIARARAANQR